MLIRSGSQMKLPPFFTPPHSPSAFVQRGWVFSPTWKSLWTVLLNPSHCPLCPCAIKCRMLEVRTGITWSRGHPFRECFDNAATIYLVFIHLRWRRQYLACYYSLIVRPLIASHTTHTRVSQYSLNTGYLLICTPSNHGAFIAPCSNVAPNCRKMSVICMS